MIGPGSDKNTKNAFLQNRPTEMAKIENMHCTMWLQPISSSWQIGLPPAFASLEQRGALFRKGKKNVLTHNSGALKGWALATLNFAWFFLKNWSTSMFQRLKGEGRSTYYDNHNSHNLLFQLRGGLLEAFHSHFFYFNSNIGRFSFTILFKS